MYVMDFCKYTMCVAMLSRLSIFLPLFQVFMKSVKLEWCLGEVGKALTLLTEAVKLYPEFSKVGTRVPLEYLLQYR